MLTALLTCRVSERKRQSKKTERAVQQVTVILLGFSLDLKHSGFDLQLA